MNNFSTKYGHFSDDGDEYIINTPKTPKPWVNVISNGKYGLVVSQNGGGFSWYTHSEFNRINRWHQDMIQDNWGKFIYVKNNETGEIWSPTWMPVKTPLDKYECRHGFGYSVFSSEYKGIQIVYTIFAPFDESFEIWDLKIKNNSGKKADLSLFTYFEWCLGSSSDFHREFHKTFIEIYFDEKLNGFKGTKRLWEIPLGDRGHWNIEYPYYGFFACSKKVSDYDADKESFIGNYGSIEKPQAIINGGSLGKKTGKWNDSVAALKTDVLLEPGKEERLNYYLGLVDKDNDPAQAINKYKTPQSIDAALENVKKKWAELFSTMAIETPDEAMNLAVNKWFRYQAISGRLWGRSAYYQQSGAFGFRDQLQDSLVFLPIDPGKTKDQLRLHARHQFQDGTVLHWWHPISETGLPTKMTDDLLWLPFILSHYLDETGDYSILDIKEPFYDNAEKQAPLFEHCKLAIEKVYTRFSERGLPLIGAGDWNDGLSAVGLEMKGESIWLAEFYYMVVERFSKLAEKHGDAELAKEYKLRNEKLRQAFDKHAWDGEWFFRATKDSGEKIGSKENKEGRIYINAQSWSVISGIAEGDKQKIAMDSAAKHLLKNNGALLFAPAYTITDKYIGYLSRYAPGRRENGGVYTHAATWAIWAYSLLKDRSNAFEAYKRLNPIYNGMNPDKYIAEPYVTPGNIDGPDSPNYGMGGWTWYTGSASWFQKVVVDWILGVRATPEGLVVDPCIPSDWKTYKVKRTYRGCIYNITVVNEAGASAGVKYLKIDGKKVEGNLITPQKKNQCEVKAYMGN